MATQSVLDVLRAAVPGAAIDAAETAEMPTLQLEPADLLEVMRVLRAHPALQFHFLADVVAVDYWPAEPRFEIVYHLACLGGHYVEGGAAAPARRLRVKVRLPGHEARIETITPVYPAANWPEREIFDHYGVVFERHPDLRRILMPEDWEGYPMRRDYPVQIRKAAQGWAPVQITAEEFAANVRAQQEHAARVAAGEAPPPPATDHGVRPVR
jgi:NADH-quinone oxidoreductase subunit C